MMTTLYAEAVEMVGDMAAVMAYCAQNGGVVHVDSECLFCAYPTSKLAVETQSQKGLDKSDAWYVYMASGNLKKAFGHIKPKQWLVFERFDGKFRIYDWERFRRLVWAV